MGWKTRGRRRYYYRGGRSSAYLGRGEAAELAAQHDDAQRQARQQDREALALTRRQFLQADAAVCAFLEFASALASGGLVAAGYHRHDRGHWRRRHPQSDGASS